MSINARRAAIQNISRRLPKAAQAGEARPKLTEIFGINVFNDAQQRHRLPKKVYDSLRLTIDNGQEIGPGIADAVASAMKDWAVERGATHFTHWFQPMTGLTAEKHDSFIQVLPDGRIINDFSGKELIKGEPDASSFPSGGLRATFEARGYTAWDATSPAFLREGPGGVTLCIPTAFCSWTTEALDKKTPLLRATEALSKQAVRLLHLLGNPGVTRVYSTTGPEQEYFLVDRELAALRLDLLMTGRTLYGARPPKGQELEDHYFGAISQRVLVFMQDLESELWKLGIPAKTRHNEVAPGQYELAPIFERTTVAADHNMLVMEMLKAVAERHGLSCLLHEKPFAGVNGSGKHNNFSMADNFGNNLLDPGTTPHENLQFVLFLTAVIRAVDIHADLLRVSIAHAANDHRLGANEAPPAIISIFLGSQLEAVVDALIGRRAPESKTGTADIRLGVTTLPPLPRDMTDRNRTSPFAFTGNKFEFRAVGSRQSIAYPGMVLNTIVAESLDWLATAIESRSGRGDLRETIQQIVSETLTQHRRILFSGDNYTQEWQATAAERGLPNFRDTPAALAELTRPKNIALLETYAVLSRRETESRQKVMYHAYCRSVAIEAHTAYQMGATQIAPACFKFQSQLADTIAKTRQSCADADLGPQTALLKAVTDNVSGLKRALDDLESQMRKLDEIEARSMVEAADFCLQSILPAMLVARERADKLESMVDDELWPLPKYRELMFMH